MRLAQSLRHNLGLKLLSVALALLLWSFIRGSKIVQREIEIPIKYVNLADSLMFDGDQPGSMKVQVSGPAQLLFFGMRSMRGVEALIDLSEASAEWYRISPGPAQISTGSNPRLVIERVIAPTILNLKLARKLEREVRVRVVLRGSVPEGYVLTNPPHAVPATVLCTGPERLIEGFNEVSTMPLELRRSRSSFTEEVELFYDRTHLTCAPDRVTVQIPMARLRNLALPETPLTIVPPSRPDLQFDIDAAQASLTLEGPEDQIDALTPEDVVLVLDISNLQPGRYDSLAIVPYLPDWARVLRLTPSTMGVTIRPESSEADSLVPASPNPPEDEKSSLP